MLQAMMCMLFLTGQPVPETGWLFEFEEPHLPAGVSVWRGETRVSTDGSGHALEVDLEYPGWSCVTFKPTDAPVWNWSAWAGLAVAVENTGTDPVKLHLTIESAAEGGEAPQAIGGEVVLPGEMAIIHVPFDARSPGGLWGMQGLPGGRLSPLGSGVDPSRITVFFLYPVWVEDEVTFRIRGVRLLSEQEISEEAPCQPFVDEFGQYMHADWPGKLHDEEELKIRAEREGERLDSTPPVPGLDEIGGWLDGPQLEATGWFRTEKVDGVWWLVTPGGRLFFSLGVNAVNTFQYGTFVEGRPGWFKQLPAKDGDFAPFYEETTHTHSRAETIGGQGLSYRFAGANLFRKYGEHWPVHFRERVYARFRAWGFNTIGTWTTDDMYIHSPYPFTVSVWIGYGKGFRRIEGGGGYWAKMPDAFDPDWERAASETIRYSAVDRGFRDNPLCIGYMIDNELSWEQVAPGVLPSPADQPARMAFVRQLKEKHGTLDALNDAWGTSAQSWDTLRQPEPPNEACQKDLDAFVHAFATKYFATLRRLLEEHAPNQLYLGCRFAHDSYTHPEAERACAEAVDVMTYNVYARNLDPAEWTGPKDLGKPVLISEFSFGATDRGSFYPGFIAVKDQEDRGRHYVRYVGQVADMARFVGCHWYQYRDNPVTGYNWMGENSNYGLVDVTDTPYEELINAARGIHEEVYVRHGAPRP